MTGREIGGSRAATGARRLILDTRWTGNHGIARYANEVSPRIRHLVDGSLGERVLAPTTVADVLNPDRLRLSRDDILYTPGFNAGPSRALQIVTIHDLIHLDHPTDARHRFYYEHLVKPVVRRAGVVLTVSETTRKRLSAWLPAGVEIINAGNGCDPVFSPDGPRHADQGPYVLMVGNAKPHKNLRVVVRALRAVEGIRLLFVGGDGEQVLHWAAEAGVGARVRWMREVSDQELAGLYRGACALVLPSLVEGFGLPALEAIRSGCPVAFSAECESVAEICRGQGWAVSDALEVRSWESALTAAQHSEITVRPVSGYSWDDVGQRVAAALSSAKGARR